VSINGQTLLDINLCAVLSLEPTETG